MFLIAHESDEAAAASAAILKKLGPAARRVLADCVENSSARRREVSKAARDLENAGFLFVRDIGTLWLSEYEITPSLLGEEALEALELQQA